MEYIPLLFLLLPHIEVFFLVSFRYLIFSICILTLFLYYFYSSLLCIFFIFTNVFFTIFIVTIFFIHFLCFRIPFLSLFLFFSFYSLFSYYSLSSPFLIAFLIHSPLRFLSLFLNPYSFLKFLFILLIVSYPILFLILSLFPFRYCISYSFSSSFLIPFFFFLFFLLSSANYFPAPGPDPSWRWTLTRLQCGSDLKRKYCDIFFSFRLLDLLRLLLKTFSFDFLSFFFLVFCFPAVFLTREENKIYCLKSLRRYFLRTLCRILM